MYRKHLYIGTMFTIDYTSKKSCLIRKFILVKIFPHPKMIKT